MKKYIGIIILQLCFLVHLRAGDDSVIYKDTIFDAKIKTLQIFANNVSINSQIGIPVAVLGQETNLIIQFDELSSDFSDFQFKLLYCNWDWSISEMNDIEVVDEYNEFQVLNYEASFNTKKEYVHYKVSFPKVLISGNYIVQMYRGDNDKDIVFYRRVMIYENKINIDDNSYTTLGTSSLTNQQTLRFTVKYNGLDVPFPNDNIHVVARKNYRWDLAKHLLPTHINAAMHQLEFSGNDPKFSFKGGNEYRKVDFRSIITRGYNINRIQNQDSLFQLGTYLDQLQVSSPYLFQQDINGRYLVDHYEFEEGHINADYVKLWFTLNSPTYQIGDIYLIGAFTDWQIKPEFKMRYSLKNKYYSCNVLLKQGYYNYKYVIVRPEGKIDEYFLEGNHYQTENEYEIMVYYKVAGQREDRLFGYKKIQINGR